MIDHLQEKDVRKFWILFKEVLNESFPGYSNEIINYFTEKIYTPRMYQYWVQQKNKTILAAWNNEDIVGFAVIDSPYGGVSLCRWLGVKKEYQKKGIGTALIKVWQKIAQEQGCHKIEVAAQPTARLFYEKAGLLLEGKRESSYFGIDQYLFGKVIGSPNNKVMIESTF